MSAPEIPKNAVAPKEWTVYSSWDVEPGDEEKQYILCTQVLYPDDAPFGPVHKKEIPIEPKKRAQILIRFVGFPVGQAGFYKVRTWVEENGKDVVAPIEFKIELEIISEQESKHETAKKPKTTQGNEKENAPHNAGRIS